MHTDVIAALAVDSVRLHEKRAVNLNPMNLVRRAAGAVRRAPKPAAARPTPPPVAPVPSAPGPAAAVGASMRPTPAPTPPTSSGAVGAASVKPPRSMGSRLFRLGAASTAAGAGAVGYGHHRNNAEESAMDPYTSYRSHAEKLRAMTEPLEQKMWEALGKGDLDTYRSIKEQIASGNYGASSWSFDGWNPFVEAGAGSRLKTMGGRKAEAAGQFSNAEQAFRDKQQALGGEIATIQSQLNDPNMLPQQRQFYATTLDNLKNSLKSLGEQSADAGDIRTKMQQSGMLSPGEMPGGTPAPAAPQTPGAPPSPSPSPPNGNPLLSGGPSNAPLSPLSFRVTPRW